MFGRAFSSKAILLMKFFVVMSCPLYYYSSSSLLSGFVFTSLFQIVTIVDAQYSFIQLLVILFRNIILGILLASLGIAFNYKIENSPMNEPYWKKALSICVILILVSYGILLCYRYLILSNNQTLVFLDYNYFNEGLIRYPSLVIAIFIGLPLIQRQAISNASSPQTHSRSYRDLMEFSQLNQEREKRIATIFWFILCFCPYLIGFLVTSSFYQFSLYGLLWNIHFHLYSGDVPVAFIIGSILAIVTFSRQLLYSIFNLYFAREIYRYNRREITLSRLKWIGLLASIFPVIANLFTLYSILFVTAYVDYYPVYIPIPTIFLLGLSITKRHSLIIESSGQILWEQQGEKQEIVTTPEPPNHPQDDTINVPIYQLVISRLRKLRDRIQR